MIVIGNPVPRALVIRYIPTSWQRFQKSCEMVPEKPEHHPTKRDKILMDLRVLMSMKVH